MVKGEGLIRPDGLGPVHLRKRKANAEPSGGGGWKSMNEKLAASRAKLRANAIPGGQRGGMNPDAMAENRAKLQAQHGTGLAYGVNEWVKGKIEEGDIEGGLSSGHSGTSIFDPVLCELVYRWFCPKEGLVLDPFAGGSVRGIVASRLGRGYLGLDLSQRQVAANEAQARALCDGYPTPRWLCGDSRQLDKLAMGAKADLVFSCPPYADLEVYSDDPRDLSVMPHSDFREAYVEIIVKACALLRSDRFACFVVGDARDGRGLYYGLPALTVDAFREGGLALYNEAVLLTAIGSLPIRVAKQFTASRKLGKTHQNVLVFVKGDPVKATQAVGEAEFGELEHPGNNGGAAVLSGGAV